MVVSPFHKRRLRSPRFWAACPGCRPPSPTWRRHRAATVAAEKPKRCDVVTGTAVRRTESFFLRLITDGLKTSVKQATGRHFDSCKRCCSVWHNPFTQNPAFSSSEFIYKYTQSDLNQLRFLFNYIFNHYKHLFRRIKPSGGKSSSQKPSRRRDGIVQRVTYVTRRHDYSGESGCLCFNVGCSCVSSLCCVYDNAAEFHRFWFNFPTWQNQNYFIKRNQFVKYEAQNQQTIALLPAADRRQIFY